MQRTQIPKPFEDLLRPARYKVYYGGRGSAKSWSFATVLLAIAANRPLRTLCGREIQLSIADSVKRLLDDRINTMGLDGFYTSINSEIVGKNGSVFLFAGLKHNVTKIKSVEGVDIAWLEEGDRISRESLDILIPTIRKPGSEIWITFNPNEPTDPVYQDFVLAEPSKETSIEPSNPVSPQQDVSRSRRQHDRRGSAKRLLIGSHRCHIHLDRIRLHFLKRLDAPTNPT